MKTRLIPKALGSTLLVFATTGVLVAAEPTATLTVEAPKDEVFAAAIAALTAMEFGIQRENEKVGMIAAQNENRFGEWNNKISIMMTEKDGVTQIEFTGQKRKWSMGGDSPEKLASRFKKTLQERLGDKTVNELPRK